MLTTISCEVLLTLKYIPPTLMAWILHGKLSLKFHSQNPVASTNPSTPHVQRALAFIKCPNI